MGESHIDIQRLTHASFAALRAGDSEKARNGFEQVVALGQADTSHWLGLAHACFRSGDHAAALGAADKALELQPRNLRALILKGDCLHNQGKPRQSVECYQYALKLAATVADVPDDIRQGLTRAQKACASQVGEYQTFLLERLKAEGFSPAASHSRFQESLDLMFGRKTIYFQQPRRYYYPGLPQIQFYERDRFNWVTGVEDKTDQIRAELSAVMEDPARFSPYVKSGDSVLGKDNQGMDDNESWGALYLWDYGRLVPENAAIFPTTLEALAAAPLPDIPGQAPMALFSKLSPDTKIPPHHGLLNTRLICHLPLIVPENCGALRVGNEERAWAEGELLIFDDSIEHEAWNTSDQERVILLFEIWRPELSEEERYLITAMLKAVKEYNTDSR